MERRLRAEPFSAGEIFLPLIFFAADEKIFTAAALTLAGAACTLFIFEMLRRLPQAFLTGVYLLWLVLCGWAGWQFLHLAPYWILALHAAVPAGARDFAPAFKNRPSMAGFKKYFRRRIKDFIFAALLFSALSALILFVQRWLPLSAVWTAAILILLLFETVYGRLRGGVR